MQGASVPVAFRNDLLRQLPALRNTFSSFDRYAQTTTEDLLRTSPIADATTMGSDTFRSSYVENTEDGFAVRPLPIRTQFAPVFGMTSGHFDDDSHRDLLLIGNSYATEPFTGRYDALHGTLLHGNGDGTFAPVDATESGFFVDGDGTALVQLRGADGHRLVVAARNDASLAAFRVDRPRNAAHRNVQPSDRRAVLHYPDGTSEAVELNYGAGYLSQSARLLTVPSSVTKVQIIARDGETRTWTP
jgi:hypothetical protein